MPGDNIIIIIYKNKTITLTLKYYINSLYKQKNFSNFQIVLIENVPINVSYSIQESWSFIGIMRTVKKEMSWSFDIITTTAKIGLSESWKPCLNLYSLKPSLNLVNNLTPLGLWQLKTKLPEGRMNFEKLFFKIFKLSELRIFRSSLFHSMSAEGKKEFRNYVLLWIKACYWYSLGYIYSR